MLRMFASKSLRMSAPNDQGEGVVAGEGLPRQEGKLGALQGCRGAESDYCWAHDPVREGTRRRDRARTDVLGRAVPRLHGRRPPVPLQLRQASSGVCGEPQFEKSLSPKDGPHESTKARQKHHFLTVAGPEVHG